MKNKPPRLHQYLFDVKIENGLVSGRFKLEKYQRDLKEQDQERRWELAFGKKKAEKK